MLNASFNTEASTPVKSRKPKKAEKKEDAFLR